ncbi:peptidoglycan DD-metalloendopeptidase family protein [Alkanindiges sp. WGS2144]|uniref:peptidoglycan DD-metalloendopeptidase family protein n=1 Tax=Alkanindiges sp. WGS2144 TaxID=3366808 RepID=UPI003750923C
MKWLVKVSNFSIHNSFTAHRYIITKKLNQSLLGAAVVIVMAGCASKPVVNPTQSRLIVVPQYYTVKQGDTLSQIAARYRLDYREIARLNNIDSSYTIYTNQSLRLHHGGKDAPRIQVRTAAVPGPVTIQTQRLPAQQPTASIRPATQASNVKAAPVNTPVSPPPILPNTPTTLPSGLNWKWPAEGAVIQQFNLAQDVKGVRIDGRVGDPVRAAADGEVVYASDRLTEYGNLVLIRHVNGYVSAYAHNSRILVSENDRVKTGQKIAEMGSSGTTQTMLEFQIRLNGKPVNPVNLLPAR